MKQSLLSLALFFAVMIGGIHPIYAQIGGNPIVITEIMYNPPEAGSDSLEFIELYNPSTVMTVDLGGYYFSNGIEYTFPPNVSLAPEAFIILAKDSVAFTGLSGIPARQFSNSLLNSGEGLTLRNAQDMVMDTVFYDNISTWPSEADGQGASLVLCNAMADNNDPSNWMASTNATGLIINGLELMADPTTIVPCNVVITEIMYNPPEAEEDSLEFLELYNPSTSMTIDLSGYYFSSGIEYVFPPNMELQPESFLILAKDSVAFTGLSGIPTRQWVSMSLLNGGEGLALRNAQDMLVDTVFYDDVLPWPEVADGQGPSLVICDVMADNNDVSNWAASTNATGLTVNGIEIMADPTFLLPCLLVGLNDETVEDGLIIFPNPSNGQFEISLGEVSVNTDLELFDVSGKMVYSESINAGNSNNIRLDLDLKHGIYILRAGEKYGRLVISE